ncbi:hypothetical protein JTB14_023719 [Gonioctena quinquepunctata]|nr:hypothetical protein JTB14_023719 [Gonioctena quinquepunctata]
MSKNGCITRHHSAPEYQWDSKPMNIYGSDEDVTSGREYFPYSDDEDPEESLSRQQIAYQRDIEKVKRNFFSEKTDNF